MRSPNLLSGQWRSEYASGRLARFTERCRRHGLAVTPQRLAVIRALLGSEDHPAAEEIFAKVRRQHPHISLATVHRTLETLCHIGEACKVTPLHDRARYDGNLDAHHHVVCISCHVIRDVEVPAFDALLKEQANLGEFKVMGGSMAFQALCARCQRRGARKAEAAPRPA